MKISSILERIDEKQLFVPAFQREYVWKREDAKELIDSLIKEYPTGTLLLWETANPPELKGPFKYRSEQGAIRVLLDGQQRVTTLYLLIQGKVPPYYTPQEITNSINGLHVNVETLELVYKKKEMENNPVWQDITDVFQGRVTAFGLKERFDAIGRSVSMAELEQLNANINRITRIKEREFPEQTIPVKATIREAIDIFYKVNASGVALTDAELALAQISGFWPEARDTFKKKLAVLKANGFVFGLDFIVYALLACVHHVGSEMKKLHGSENNDAIRAAWKRLDEQVLDYVVNLIRSHAFVDHTDEINSVYALIPVIAYCHDQKGRHLDDLEIRKVIRWFYYSQIRSRYISQLPQRLDQDLRVIERSSTPFDELLGAIAEQNRLEIMPHEFVGRPIQHPLFSLMRWYFKSRGAVCFTTGMQLRQNMGAKYQLEKDHIFAYSRLKKAGYGQENRLKYPLAQEFTNRAILTQVANRTKAGASAEDYLAGVVERFPKALELQCVPEKPELWKIENYEQFLEHRRKLLAKALNAFLDGIAQPAGEGPGVSIEQLIEAGESEELEFKQTLRWSVDESVVNKKLEEVVAKTVAAFGNSQGGTLLIGVDDAGGIRGLGPDLESLGGADRDKFELHLRSVLNKSLGGSFVATRVQVRFPVVNGLEICRVDVEPSSKPIVIEVTEKAGPAQRFYVRSGNRSEPLSLVEMNTYVKERFFS
jgi:hypothetical protein